MLRIAASTTILHRASTSDASTVSPRIQLEDPARVLSKPITILPNPVTHETVGGRGVEQSDAKSLSCFGKCCLSSLTVLLFTLATGLSPS